MAMRDHFSLSRLNALESRYRATRRKLADELKRPSPDSIRIQQLKRKRLWLKDQITELVRPSTSRMPIHG